MDNPSFSNDENRWVEDRIARLSPPPGWKPDPERAFERVMQEQGAASTSRGLRISLAAATLVLIAAILTLLPWNVLWPPRAAESIVTAQERTTPAPTGDLDASATRLRTLRMPITRPLPPRSPKSTPSEEG